MTKPKTTRKLDPLEYPKHRAYRAGHCEYPTDRNMRGKCWRPTTTYLTFLRNGKLVDVFRCYQHWGIE